MFELKAVFPLPVFGFIATIVFALDFYFIFNELADFLKGGGSRDEPQNTQGNLHPAVVSPYHHMLLLTLKYSGKWWIH